MPASFHEVRFPLALSYGSRGGPERRTEIVTLGSGDEERNALWRHSRRAYNAGPALRRAEDIALLLAFFEERRGPLYGFRWRDTFDHASCALGRQPAATDQPIGTGDGSTTVFQLAKTYGAAFAPYVRPIVKPVAGSVRVAVNGAELPASAVTVDPTTGRVTLATAPAAGAAVTAGFLFDVPVRFATDRIEIDHQAVLAGVLADIPILELRR
ncbi:phage distal tail protein, Rcc01695 family [Methylobacterium sp. ID0610]|uniref:phage distal tail protein, Rcc01695 family n=1 Tax=Methylobacterium carpenticola TaxID=3344827 RepID=UPI0036B6440B